MKAARFDYVCPTTLDEAIELLSRPGLESKVIAGGQSLMPIMNFRLATPDVLVDLRKIPDLAGIHIDGSGLRLGAKVRWCDIEADGRLKAANPLLAAAVEHVAHYQVRNRGTVGGSLAHADSAAELPGVAVTCDAEIVALSARGRRVIPAGAFFLGPLTTALEADEIIVELRFPAWPAARRSGFKEFSRRRGDFALSGIGLFFDQDDAGCIQNAHVGVIGACDHPTRLTAVEDALNGGLPDATRIAAAAELVKETVDPTDDLHASAAYRRALSATLFERALHEALS